jgi:hypothetical protein
MQPLPLSSQDRWIVDANGRHVPYVGINWPGAADVMIPEGLQYQSIKSIAGKLTETGFNVVRLTFAIEMVDDILDNGGDVTLQDALCKALGTDNGMAILSKMLANNPQFTPQTTRLQVFDAVAAELAAQNIYLHLDNHVSKAMWCCALNDGNSWFGDTYFDTSKWIRGLSYMAAHGKAHWPTFASVGLRNELRPSTAQVATLLSYNWNTWKTYMTSAASAVHAANLDLLIFFSGLDSDFNIEPAVGGSAAQTPGFTFHVSDYEWSHKLVFELHEYDEQISGWCWLYQRALDTFGFDATYKSGSGTNRAPLVISEWGHDQSDASGTYNSNYATCLRSFMAERALGWMMWVLAGSYYVRSGVQDPDESYGLLNHDWSGYRGDKSLQAIKDLISATYAQYGQ